MTTTPLIVDLDGTLIKTDMLYESFLVFLHTTPLQLYKLPGQLAQGKARLKEYLAEHSSVNPALLPFNTPFLNWLEERKANGQPLILCTATDAGIAEKIADHLGIFDQVLASDGQANIKGEQKAQLLTKRFGKEGFDYCGNDDADLPVWECARKIIVVNASTKTLQEAKKRFSIDKIFHQSPLKKGIWFRLLRSHQWVKNLLLFVPIAAAHMLFTPDKTLQVLLAFISFCCCASTFYIVNDLLDLESDRQHPTKCRRPFASGAISIDTGMTLIPFLFFFSIATALIVGSHFLGSIVCYMVMTTFYSIKLKKLPLLDCLCLAFLYDIRIIAGAAAIQIPLSYWLITFAIFLFFSLAFLKRYTEILNQPQEDDLRKLPGRGYTTADASIIQTMGLTSGYLSVLVLALYLNTDVVIELYHTPILLWPAVPVMLFWISWLWLQACRGNMNEDPVLYAIQDTTSLITAALLSLFIISATITWP